MKKFNKKMINVVTTAALVASVVAPIAVSAATDARVSEVVVVASDAKNVAISTLTFKEDTDYASDLVAGKTFTLTFPQGAKIKNTVNNLVNLGGTNLNGLNGGKVEIVGDYTVNVTLPNDTSITDAVQTINITPIVTIDGLTGNSVDVVVDSFGSGVKAGTYTLAQVVKGATTSVVLNTKTIGEAGGELGSIRLTENSNGSLKKGKVTFKLPKGITWNEDTAVKLSAGLASIDGDTDEYTVTGFGTSSLVINFLNDPSTSQRGIIQVTPNVDVDTDDAKYGDITVSLTGTDVTDQDLKVGSYSDFAVVVKADGDAKALTSGLLDTDDLDKHKLQTLVIKENVPGSFVTNRKAKIEFPSAVKVAGVKIEATNASDFPIGTYLYDADEKKFVNADGDAITNLSIDKNTVEFTPKNEAEKKAELKFTFYVSVKADYTGEIEANVTGRAGFDGKVVLGNATAPITVTAESKEVKVGVKEQAIGNVVITEAKKDILKKDEVVTVTLKDGIKWSKKPTVTVTEGDLEIEKDSVKTDGSKLSFTVKAEGTKPSEITISNGFVDLDRTVAEGPILAEVAGDFIQNGEGKDSDQVVFDKNTIAKFEIAKVVTPAPGEARATAQFVIDSTSYKVNGAEKTLDVAPFIQDGRTFLPVRFVAEALGVSESNIIWNANTKTVTLIKGDRIAQIQLGSSNLVVNGVSVPMDTVAFVKEGRTVLPLRYAAQALGADVQWDEATRTVTISR
ncbi:copper amine oxidase N-terminal domain-containing protein [Ammoniphilus sp. YIM 78166]|uniref:copper amine oxidase N-terminal domain-containing protein n=1 Tax=Ammoniphilus sp. YIM 78166 TaxID=1644106 RepID=UPI0010700558|nr:copper amine oxidase N-terminal domain-containing protein [Ammoniphilus sp. YIM 78166]